MASTAVTIIRGFINQACKNNPKPLTYAHVKRSMPCALRYHVPRRQTHQNRRLYRCFVVFIGFCDVFSESLTMPGGRPLKFSTPEELQEKIDAYFSQATDSEGKVIKPITITGLALWLDTTRDVLLDYQNRDEFSHAIKKAKLRVECYYEEKLMMPACTGSIFALKNFGWSDRNETKLTHEGGDPAKPIGFTINFGITENASSELHSPEALSETE